MFKQSEKVVCVDDRPSVNDGIRYLVKGQVYDVCGVYTPGYTLPPWPPNTYGVYLTGIVTTSGKGFASVRFRKLDEVKAENALARQIVNGEYAR